MNFSYNSLIPPELASSSKGWTKGGCAETLVFEIRKIVAERISGAFNINVSPDRLEKLHEELLEEDQEVDEFLINNVTRVLYDLDKEFDTCYRGILLALRDLLGPDFHWQSNATIRAHFPVKLPTKFKHNGVFLGHHTDGMLGHPPREINVWLPLTRCSKSSSLQLLDLEASLQILDSFVRQRGLTAFDYHNVGRQEFFEFLSSDDGSRETLLAESNALDLSPGEFVIFDSRCIHGPSENIEPVSRFSIDLRLLDVSYNKTLNGTYRAKRSGKLFESGNVFSVQTLADLAPVK